MTIWEEEAEGSGEWSIEISHTGERTSEESGVYYYIKISAAYSRT